MKIFLDTEEPHGLKIKKTTQGITITSHFPLHAFS